MAYSADHLSNEERQALEGTYQRFEVLSRWPVVDDVDDYLDSAGIENGIVVLHGLAQQGFIHGFGPAGPLAGHEPVVLSLTGVAATASWNPTARQDLDLVGQLVQSAVKTRDAARFPAQPRLSIRAFFEERSDSGIDPARANRLYVLWLATCGPLFKNTGGDPPMHWTAELNRRTLKHYRGVFDGESLLRADRQRRIREATERLSAPRLAQGAAQAIRDPAPTPGHSLAGVDETEGTLTASDLELLALLEYLYDAGSTEMPNDLRAYDGPPQDRPRLVEAADASGYVTTFRRQMTLDETHPPLILNSFGVRRVEEVRAAREDVPRRRRACRNAFLAHVERTTQRERVVNVRTGLPKTPANLYFGIEFTLDEIIDAASYLVEQGLLGASPRRGGQISSVGLTAEGRRCVEDFGSNVRAFQARGGSQSVSYSQHFNAPVTGQVGQGQQVHQVQNQGGVSPELLAQLLAPVEREVHNLEDADDRQILQLAIEAVRAEVLHETADRAEVAQKASFLQRTATRIGATAVTTATTLATTELLAALSSQV